MHQNTIPLLLALLRSVLQQRPLTEFESSFFSEDLLPELFSFSRKHDLAHLVGQPLERAGLLSADSEYAVKFRTIQKQAILRYEQANYALHQIEDTLERAQICFVPLKGAVIRPYYPQPWMRTGCDVDVLVHREQLDAAVQALVSDGWQVHGKQEYHDISLFSPGGVHLELHFSLNENMATLDTVLQTVWQHCTPLQEGGFQYRQSNTFLLFHLLAHMAFHFIAGGCGLRSFLDIELLQDLPIDSAVLDQLCKQAGIFLFYQNVLAVNRTWFHDAAHTEKTLRIQHFVVGGGLYGSSENRIIIQQAQAGGRKSGLLQRIFLPYDKLKTQYPVLERHRWLTPFFWVVRWFRMIFRGKFKRSVREWKIARRHSLDQINQTADFLKDIGL